MDSLDGWILDYSSGELSAREVVLLIADSIEWFGEEDVRRGLRALSSVEPPRGSPVMGAHQRSGGEDVYPTLAVLGRELEDLSLNMSADVVRAGTFGLPFGSHARRIAEIALRVFGLACPGRFHEPHPLRLEGSETTRGPQRHIGADGGAAVLNANRPNAPERHVLPSHRDAPLVAAGRQVVPGASVDEA